MKYYDKKITAKKGVAAAAEGGVVVGVLLFVFNFLEIEVTETQLISAVAVLMAVWRAFNNWRKNKKHPILPPWTGFCIALFCCFLFLGCAHNVADFREGMTSTDFNPDGTVANITESHTSFKQANTVTWGSELQEGAGNMSYDWSEEGGYIAVGNAATEMKAGEVDIVRIVEILKQPGESGAPMWMELLRMGLQFYASPQQ